MKASLDPTETQERKKCLFSSNKSAHFLLPVFSYINHSPEYKLIWGKENLFLYIFMDFEWVHKKNAQTCILNRSVTLAVSSASLNYQTSPEINRIMYFN